MILPRGPPAISQILIGRIAPRLGKLKEHSVRKRDFTHGDGRAESQFIPCIFTVGGRYEIMPLE